MKKKLILSAVALFAFAFLLQAPSDAQYRRVQRSRLYQSLTQRDVNVVMQQFPDSSAQVVDQLTQKYGLPHEGTASMLIWHNVGPWKRLIAHKEEVPHNFPAQHVDVLEGVIDYRVPPDRMDDIALFNGSLAVNRTRGELSVRCENEAMDLLVLNLVDDVVNGQRTAQAARETLVQVAQDFINNGRQNAMTQRLEIARRLRTNDPDRPAYAVYQPQR